MSKADIDLKIIRENLEYQISIFDQAPRPPTFDVAYSLALAETSVRLRQMAIAQILMEADRPGFIDNLRRSAELRIELLFRTTGHQADAPLVRHIAGTRFRLGPFLDGLASGDLELGKRIAVASVAPFDKRYEYEDDHVYGQILFDCVTSGAAPAPLMQRFQEILEGQPSARLEVCRAILGRDAEALDGALASLADEHAALFAEKGEGIVADPDEFATERHVSVEGLAIKVLAKTMGLAVADEHRFMPRQAFVAAPY